MLRGRSTLYISEVVNLEIRILRGRRLSLCYLVFGKTGRGLELLPDSYPRGGIGDAFRLPHAAQSVLGKTERLAACF